MTLDEKNYKKTALKLHRQFGHPTSSRLISLLHKAEIKNDDLELEIINLSRSCEICCKFKKPVPRPVVCLPMAQKFNEVVSMDLKVRKNGYFLVMVDMATRYCAAKLIRSKQPAVILKALFLNWISTFGPPSKFLSDNGREWNNSELRELGEAFNIKILTTAAESSWSNGMCERLNGVIAGMVDKIMLDSKCEEEIALAWAVSARNSLDNNFGFSPNQLVFSFNPCFPNLSCNNPPAFENVESSDMVRNNLNALHSARQEFIKCESSERIRRALRHNTRETSMLNIQTGDEVYYKRKNSNQWHGPGTVIGRDGKQVIVKHGGEFYRVHACRLSQANDVDNEKTIDVSPHVDLKNTNETAGEKTTRVDDYEEETEDEDETENDCEEEDGEANNEETNREQILPEQEDRPFPVQQIKIGQRVRGLHTDSGQVISGKVVSRAGKSTGKFNKCFNIRKDSDGSIDWYDVERHFEHLEVIPDEEELFIFYNTGEIHEAKEKEMNNWRTNKVFSEVEDTGQEAISTRWVITEKMKDGNGVVKARLVARGFEEEKEDIRKDSPTCTKESVRIALSLASALGWKVKSTDVKAAFLQGNIINREVFLRPPSEFYCGKLWKLHKTVYGLRDAARAWYLRVEKVLMQLGMLKCKYDPALFYWMKKGSCQGVICVHVDDFLSAGTELFEDEILKKLEENIQIGNSESGNFKYLGHQIQKCSNGITLDQIHYAYSIKKIEVSVQR